MTAGALQQMRPTPSGDALTLVENGDLREEDSSLKIRHAQRKGLDKLGYIYVGIDCGWNLRTRRYGQNPG